MSDVSTAAGAQTSRVHCLYDSLPLRGHGHANSNSSKAEIRVFDLRLDQDNASLAGILRIVDLNSEPKSTFTALSYCWAQAPSERCAHLPREATNPASTSRGIITSNSQYQIELPWNCVDALWHLRKAHRPSLKNYLTIWVDSICINQKDDEEKDYQINLMSKIYASAEVTYFWLGSGSKATDSAMNYLLKVGGQEYKYAHDFPWSLVYDLDFGLLLRLWGSSILPFLGQPYFEELDELFHLPWIQRLWTFQEAMLPSDAEMYCGDKRIPWTKMVLALEYLNMHARTPPGLIFPGSFGDWHRLSVSWREKRVSDRTFDEYKTKPWTELTTYEAVYMQKLSLIWRILFTGTITQLLVVLCANGIITACCLAILNDDNSSVSEVIPLYLLMLAGILMWALYGRSKHRKLATIDTQLPSAQSLLGELLRRQSDSEKDKYFALLGIIGDQNTTRPTQQSSIDDLYKQLSLDIIRHRDSLDVLLYAPGIPDSPFSSSWIVDWRDCSNIWDVCRWRLTSVEKGFFKTLMCNILGDTNTPGDMLEQYPGPHGLLRTYLERCCVPLGHGLFVKGIFIGRIAGLQKPIPFRPIRSDSGDEALLQSVSSFQEVAQRMSAELREKFFQYLGALLVSGRGCSTDMRPGRKWAALFSQIVKNASGRESEDLSRETLRRLLGQTPRWWSSVCGQTDTMAAWKHHVKLVKFLSEGKMVVFDFEDLSPWRTGQIYGGLAPQDIQDLDIVVFLHQCPMPMILRRNLRGSYAVVGPSFIPGMMDAEPMSLSKERNAGPWNWKDLELV